MNYDNKRLLKEYCLKGSPVGKINGDYVFVTTKAEYINKKYYDRNDCYFLIYDDNNFIVFHNRLHGRVHGDGIYDEYNIVQREIYYTLNDEVKETNDKPEVSDSKAAEPHSKVEVEVADNRATQSQNDLTLGEYFESLSKTIDELLKMDFQY